MPNKLICDKVGEYAKNKALAVSIRIAEHLQAIFDKEVPDINATVRPMAIRGFAQILLEEYGDSPKKEENLND